MSATSDVCGSGQGEDQGSVQLLRLGWQNRLRVVEEASELWLHFRAPQGCDQPQGRALNTGVWDMETAKHHCQAGNLQQMVDIIIIKNKTTCALSWFCCCMKLWVHITTDAAGSGWSEVQQPGCAGDWGAGLCSAAGCGASCSWTSPARCEGFPMHETWTRSAATGLNGQEESHYSSCAQVHNLFLCSFSVTQMFNSRICKH